MAFAIVWIDQSPMIPEYHTIDEILSWDIRDKRYGTGNHFYVPADYSDSLRERTA